MYTLKGHEHAQNRQVWIEKNSSKSFSTLWTSSGKTKTLTYKGISTQELQEGNGNETSIDNKN